MNALWIVAGLAALRGWVRLSLRWFIVAYVAIVLAVSLPVHADASGSVSYRVSYRGKLTMTVYAPENPNGKAVMVVHGGGWWTGTPLRVQRICQEIVAANGFTCFAPRYTLSGSRPFPAANKDLLAAVRYIKTEGFSEVGAVGLSAGGNLVAWLATKGVLGTSVVWSAPTDLVRLVSRDWAPASCRCGGVIRQYAPSPQKRLGASPALHTNHQMGSMLIVHSAHEMIPLAQAVRLDRAIPTEHRLSVVAGSRHGAALFGAAGQETAAWLVSHL